MHIRVASCGNLFPQAVPDNISPPDRIYPEADSILEARVEIIIVIVLIVLLFGSFPIFPYSRDWGYRGSGVLGTILAIVVILWLLGRI